jgi:hypothetical protein
MFEGVENFPVQFPRASQWIDSVSIHSFVKIPPLEQLSRNLNQTMDAPIRNIEMET